MITDLDVALVSASAALAAVVVNPVATWLTTRATLRHAEDERTRDMRREAYTRLLAEERRRRLVIDEWLRITRTPDRWRGRDFPPFDYPTLLETMALANIYASDEVHALIDELDGVAFPLVDELNEANLADAAVRAELATRLEAARRSLEDLFTQLRETMANELGVRELRNRQGALVR